MVRVWIYRWFTFGLIQLGAVPPSHSWDTGEKSNLVCGWPRNQKKKNKKSTHSEHGNTTGVLFCNKFRVVGPSIKTDIGAIERVIVYIKVFIEMLAMVCEWIWWPFGQRNVHILCANRRSTAEPFDGLKVADYAFLGFLCVTHSAILYFACGSCWYFLGRFIYFSEFCVLNIVIENNPTTSTLST